MKKINITPVIILLCFLFFSIIFPAYAKDRGLSVLPIKDKSGNQVGLYKKSYALIIGVSNYTNGWPDIPGVKKDVKLVTRALIKQGFKVEAVEDPDLAEMKKSFTSFINRYGQEEDNRLIFYFAGHGYTVKLSYGEEMGYIVPADAPNPNMDKQGFLAAALDMQMIEVYAKRIQSKHALFLFDSCFSGALFAMTRAIPENITYKTSKPVRQFITSGSAEEKVSDNSVFRHQFIEGIQGESDRNNDGYITGTELGEFLQEKVVNYTKGAQHPQYGKIRNPNLDKGDFVFLAGGNFIVEILQETRKTAKTKSALIVKSDPGGARMYINGNLKGKTPKEIALPPGKYKITVEKDRYKKETKTVMLRAGRQLQISFVMDSKTGSLQVKSIPSSSEIFINGIYYGTTPDEIKELTPGERTSIFCPEGRIF